MPLKNDTWTFTIHYESNFVSEQRKIFFTAFASIKKRHIEYINILFDNKSKKLTDKVINRFYEMKLHSPNIFFGEMMSLIALL